MVVVVAAVDVAVAAVVVDEDGIGSELGGEDEVDGRLCCCCC